MSDRFSDSDAVLCTDGRLSQPPEDILVASAFKSELQEQLCLSEEMNRVDIAHVIGLVEAKVIKKKVGADLLNALQKLQENPTDFQADPKFGDLFTNRENWLEQHSSAVGWLCAGRARRESTTVAYHLTIKKILLDLADEITALMRVMMIQVSAHKASVMPDYTYMQPGQPTTFGHYLHSFVFMLMRDLARIESLYGRVNCCPAGCGGINGSTLQIDREKLSSLLGFARPVMHTRDAMWQADISIEIASVSTSILVTLDRFCEDVLYFVTEEFNYIELQDSCSRASKVMPQKKNPYALAYIRALANKAIGIQNMVVVSQRTPTGQIDNRLFLYGEIPFVLKKSIEGIGLLKNVVEGLQFKTSNAVNRVRESYAMAAELAEQISVENNLDYRTAHKIVGKIVRNFIHLKKHLFELTELELNEAASDVVGRPISCSRQILEILNSPHVAIEKKSGLGGTSKERIKEMIEYSKQEINYYKKWTDNEREKITQAENALSQYMRTIINQAQ